MSDIRFLVENEVYSTPAERDVYVNDRTKAAQLLAINFFGTLGVINSAQAHNHPFWSNKVVKLMKSDKQVQLSNIKDDNSDLSVTLKISVDAGLWKNESSPREITRFLAKMKTIKPDTIDNAVLLKWAQDLKPDFAMTLQDPVVRQAWLDWVQSGGVRDISAFSEQVRKKSRKLGITGFFVSTLASYGGLKAAPDHQVDGTAAQQSINSSPTASQAGSGDSTILASVNAANAVTSAPTPPAPFAGAVLTKRAVVVGPRSVVLDLNSRILSSATSRFDGAALASVENVYARVFKNAWSSLLDAPKNVEDMFVAGITKYMNNVQAHIDATFATYRSTDMTDNMSVQNFFKEMMKVKDADFIKDSFRGSFDVLPKGVKGPLDKLDLPTLRHVAQAIITYSASMPSLFTWTMDRKAAIVTISAVENSRNAIYSNKDKVVIAAESAVIQDLVSDWKTASAEDIALRMALVSSVGYYHVWASPNLGGGDMKQMIGQWCIRQLAFDKTSRVIPASNSTRTWIDSYQAVFNTMSPDGTITADMTRLLEIMQVTSGSQAMSVAYFYKQYFGTEVKEGTIMKVNSDSSWYDLFYFLALALFSGKKYDFQDVSIWRKALDKAPSHVNTSSNMETLLKAVKEPKTIAILKTTVDNVEKVYRDFNSTVVANMKSGVPDNLFTDTEGKQLLDALFSMLDLLEWNVDKPTPMSSTATELHYAADYFQQGVKESLSSDMLQGENECGYSIFRTTKSLGSRYSMSTQYVKVPSGSGTLRVVQQIVRTVDRWDRGLVIREEGKNEYHLVQTMKFLYAVDTSSLKLSLDDGNTYRDDGEVSLSAIDKEMSYLNKSATNTLDITNLADLAKITAEIQQGIKDSVEYYATISEADDKSGIDVIANIRAMMGSGLDRKLETVTNTFGKPWVSKDVAIRGIVNSTLETPINIAERAGTRKIPYINKSSSTVSTIAYCIVMATGISMEEASQLIKASLKDPEAIAYYSVTADPNNASDEEITRYITSKSLSAGLNSQRGIDRVRTNANLIEKASPETIEKFALIALKADQDMPDKVGLQTLAAIGSKDLLKEALATKAAKDILAVDWGALPARSDTDKYHKREMFNLFNQILVACDGDDAQTAVILESVSRATFDVLRGSAVGIDMIKTDIQNSPIDTFTTAFDIRAVLRLNGIDISQLSRNIGVRLKPSESRMEHIRRVKEAIDKRESVIKPPMLGDELSEEEVKKLNQRNIAKHYAARHGYTYPIIRKAWNMTAPNIAEFDAFKESKPNSKSVNPAFHGTGGVAANMISRYGFTILPESANVSGVNIAGRMLGNGIYFAPNVDKSSQYVSNNGFRAGGGRGVQGYMFEMDATLGDYYTDHQSAGLGGDSIRSAEYAVYKPQQQLKFLRIYLVEIIELGEARNLLKESSYVSFKDFLAEDANSVDLPTYNTYIFTNGHIPVINDEGVLVPMTYEAALEGGYLEGAVTEKELHITVSIPGDEEITAVVVDPINMELETAKAWIKDMNKLRQMQSQNKE